MNWLSMELAMMENWMYTWEEWKVFWSFRELSKVLANENCLGAKFWPTRMQKSSLRQHHSFRGQNSWWTCSLAEIVKWCFQRGKRVKRELSPPANQSRGQQGRKIWIRKMSFLKGWKCENYCRKERLTWDCAVCKKLSAKRLSPWKETRAVIFVTFSPSNLFFTFVTSLFFIKFVTFSQIITGNGYN